MTYTMDPLPPRPPRRRMPRRLVVLLLLGIGGWIAWRQAVPWAMHYGLQRAWSRYSPAPIHFTLRSARIGRVVLSHVRLGPEDRPLARAETMDLRFRIHRLRQGTGTVLRIQGLETEVRQTDTGWSMPLAELFSARDPTAPWPALPSPIPFEALYLSGARIVFREDPGITTGQWDIEITAQRESDGIRMTGHATGRQAGTVGGPRIEATLSAEGWIAPDGTGGWKGLLETWTEAGIALPPWIDRIGLRAQARIEGSSTSEWQFDLPAFDVEPFAFAGLQRIHVEQPTLRGTDQGPAGIRLALQPEHTTAKATLTLDLLPDRPGWTLSIEIPPFVLEESDAMQEFLRRHLPLADLRLTGKVGGSMRMRSGAGRSPITTLRIQAHDMTLGADRWSLQSLAGTAEFFLRQSQWRTLGEQSMTFQRSSIGDLGLGGGRIRWHLEPDFLRVTSAELDWLGGQIRAYALSFDLKQHDTEFVVYADRIDVGEVLRILRPLSGSGEGRLFGRLPVRLEQGRWKLTTAYLYSMPGQEGLIRIRDPQPLIDMLSRAGLARSVRRPLADALHDFRFTTFALELHPPDESGDALLSVHLAGHARDPARPTPVHATLNLRGPLETLLNMGMVFGREKE